MASNGIFIVDDNPINLKLVRLVLQGEGYEVHTAGDANETRAALEHVKPDLILMDLQLPVVSGFELTRQLRQDRRFDAVWIVALTACAMPGDELKALAAGCDGYVTKPIDTEALPATIAAFLARRRANAEI